jgi:ribonuclease G
MASPEIDKLLQSKILLKSGGYIVINQTEALVSIDVNTGKFVGRGNSLEETITRTNIEAVKEIVRQIRLRDLGGIIVIDFIDWIRKNHESDV